MAREQQYEGPWEKMQTLDARSLNEHFYGESRREHFDRVYGEQNWEFNTDAHSLGNETQRAATQAEFKIASEGLSNYIGGGEYELDDGTSLDNRIQRRAVSDMGDALVSPDGKNYAADSHSSDQS